MAGARRVRVLPTAILEHPGMPLLYVTWRAIHIYRNAVVTERLSPSLFDIDGLDGRRQTVYPNGDYRLGDGTPIDVFGSIRLWRQKDGGQLPVSQP